MKRKHLKRASFFEFPPAVIAGGLSMNLYENIGFSVENYNEILTYTDTLIRLQTSNGVLKVEGEKFCIMDMDSDTLMVSGRVKSVIYENDERI